MEGESWDIPYTPEHISEDNGSTEIRSGNTPSGLFSPAEGESWDIPYTPEHTSKPTADLDLSKASQERDLDTPEPRPLDALFTPDAPHGGLTKKVTTRFISNYDENLLDEDLKDERYTGPKIIAWVEKTVVPCYILQMPKEVRARIYKVNAFPLRSPGSH